MKTTDYWVLAPQSPTSCVTRSNQQKEIYCLSLVPVIKTK